MPYSKSQISLFGVALSMKRGETEYGYSKSAAEIARSTSSAELKKMIHEGVKRKSRRIK